MKIQLITNNPSINSFSEFKISSLNKPCTFDLYDINIVDLSYEKIWESGDNNFSSVSCINDLLSIKYIISNAKTSTVLFVLPQNTYFKCGRSKYNGRIKYAKIEQIKDVLDYTSGIFKNIFEEYSFANLFYENSITRISGKDYPSAFVFRFADEKKSLALAEGSGKSTVLREGNHIATTLDILKSEETVTDFLKGIGIYSEETEPFPEWLQDYEILDDSEQKELIAEKIAQIEEANLAIQSAEDKLNENLEFKSILYENGDSLVEHAYKILQEVLNKDMSNFIDEKKEDFNVSFDNVTFIGEIKGVTSNVKSEHISQLDVHCQGYKDKLQEENKEENVKGLLVINPLRNKPLEDREPIHEQQIALAKRNESLIIETELLLELFEKFRNNEITTEKIIEVFSTETGLLKMEAF